MADNLTTELSAVNTMLRAISEAPVNTLEGVSAVDAVLAKNVLDEIRAEVQTIGWHFNRDKRYALAVEQSFPFEVGLPDNIIQVSPHEEESADFVIRGQKLWDTENHSFSFEGRTSLLCDIVWSLSFDEMPEVARRYVAVRAARVFQDDFENDPNEHRFKQSDEARAYAALQRAESRNARRNILNNRSSQNILNRHIR